MRFMMLMHPAVRDNEWLPDAEAVGAMSKYNEELTKAGVLLALDGLYPPSEGGRVAFSGGRGRALDGPFAEGKEIVGGYWVIQARSTEEAMEWASRCPAADGDVIEVRRVYELSDFPPDVREAATLSQQPPEQTTAG
jgi:hypothetical protein